MGHSALDLARKGPTSDRSPQLTGERPVTPDISREPACVAVSSLVGSPHLTLDFAVLCDTKRDRAGGRSLNAPLVMTGGERHWRIRRLGRAGLADGTLGTLGLLRSESSYMLLHDFCVVFEKRAFRIALDGAVDPLQGFFILAQLQER